MTKAELRKHYKNKRAKLSAKIRDEFSIAIANQLLHLPIWEHTYFHLFLPIEPLKEINTEYILHILQGKDKSCIISKSDFSTFKMTHFLLQDATKITVNSFGIPEPEDGLEINPSKIQVVFIPLLAFDTQGNRIGYGKGFYDRFLADCDPDCIKIGLSFFNPEHPFSTITENDVQLDYCVTPDTIFKF